MRVRLTWLVGISAAGAVGLAVLSLGRGQDRPPPAAASPSAPGPSPTGVTAPTAAGAKSEKARDLSKLPWLHRQMYQSALAGADWLCRANRPDGRFVSGYIPALKTALEGDHFQRQAGAAFALARAARFTGDKRQAAVASQAVLTLLLDTALDPQNPRIRYPNLPATAVNRLAAAGLLILAINELPEPGEDLLEQSEQLCAFIARQQRADGSLWDADLPAGAQGAPPDPDGLDTYQGEALYALMRSQQYRPAASKTDLVRKALAYYRPWWRAHKSVAPVPWHTAAYAEAFLLTKGQEPAFADGVHEMSEWVCTLQYAVLDPRHPIWVGGFMGWVDGKPAALAPTVGSAACAEGLAAACRVARQAGDLPRYQRYRDALERCLQFLTTLQYTEANTQHFADWYRPALVGGFYGSHQDGTLRIDHTQHAVSALVQYLTYVAATP